MVRIVIEEKITDEILMTGQKLQIEYMTGFNNGYAMKTFPDDFTPEQQLLFKQIYEMIVYESEIGRKVYKCDNVGKSIILSGFTRTGNEEENKDFFTLEDLIKLRFTRYGIGAKHVEVEVPFGEVFSEEQLVELSSIGIEINGTSSNFEILSFDADISIEVVKDELDSIIDLGEFSNGKAIFKK